MPEIADSFKKIAAQAEGQKEVQIETAVALSSEAERAIIIRLEKMTGSKIVVKKKIDPLLIGGVVLKLQNRVFDGSVKNNIERIRKELTNIGIA